MLPADIHVFNLFNFSRVRFRARQLEVQAKRQDVFVSEMIKQTWFMGFGISVYSAQVPNSLDCHHFIDRSFYGFIAQGESYGNESILMKAGNYYGLDLSPFLKLVYTWDEVTTDSIEENLQDLDFLLTLTKAFRDRVQDDNSVCDKIKYVWYERPIIFSQAEKDKLITEMGEELARLFLDSLEKQKKNIEANPNPWKWYFIEGQIIEDLNNLLKILHCLKDKGATEVYLTAG